MVDTNSKRRLDLPKLERHIRGGLEVLRPDVLSATTPRYARTLARRLARGLAPDDHVSDTAILALVDSDREDTIKYWQRWDESEDNVRSERGILREVWEGRTYRRWPDPLTRDEWTYEIPDVYALSVAPTNRSGGERTAGTPARFRVYGALY